MQKIYLSDNTKLFSNKVLILRNFTTNDIKPQWTVNVPYFWALMKRNKKNWFWLIRRLVKMWVKQSIYLVESNFKYFSYCQLSFKNGLYFIRSSLTTFYIRVCIKTPRR